MTETLRTGITRGQARARCELMAVTLVAGLGVMLLGAAMIWPRVALELNGVRAPGTVTKVEAGMTSGRFRGAVYYPVVAFSTGAGDAALYRAPIGQRHPAWRPGERVRVVYMPGDPGHAAIVGDPRPWRVPGVLLVFGASLAFLSRRWMRDARRLLAG